MKKISVTESVQKARSSGGCGTTEVMAHPSVELGVWVRVGANAHSFLLFDVVVILSPSELHTANIGNVKRASSRRISRSNKLCVSVRVNSVFKQCSLCSENAMTRTTIHHYFQISVYCWPSSHSQSTGSGEIPAAEIAKFVP